MILHIAYVENDQQLQSTFQHMVNLFSARGIECTLRVYDTQLAALNELPYERPDVVFVNLRMRNGRQTAGLDIVRVLGQHPLCQAITIVGVAEYAIPADRSAALAAGCHGFLPIPAHFQDVEDMIRRIPPLVGARDAATLS